MRGKGILIGGIAIIVLAGAGGIALHSHRKQAPQTVRASGAAVIATSDLTVSGAIRPQHIVSVGAEIPGTVEAYLVDVGQEVYEGQLLARVGASALDSARESASHALELAQEQVLRQQGTLSGALLEASRADADAQRSRAELDRVDKLYSRQKTLFAAGATPRLTYQKVEGEYEAASNLFEAKDKAARASQDEVDSANQRLNTLKKAAEDKAGQLESAETAMQAAEIRAPADGLVVGKNSAAGQQPGETARDVFQIATDMFALEVSLDVPPAAVNRIHPGQAALVLILDLQSAGFPGQVKSVDGNRVVVEFSSNLPSIRPGMRADVRFKLD